jgi:hypothetical protein
MRPRAWRVALALAMALGSAAASAATVHPSGASVPENLLRIELRFEAPLQAPLALSQVRLLDADGIEIESAFLDLTLPSADGRRVTLLLHPARVKTGVGANVALGRALHAGFSVTLVVDGAAEGSRPGERVRKTWQVTPFDAGSPDPDRWRFTPPAPGSRAPLALQLDRALNASAEAMIAVRGPDGERVPGRARLEAGETRWRFTPARPWRAGRHAIVTHPDLETPAGNRPCAPFEALHAQQGRCGGGTERPFEIGR